MRTNRRGSFVASLLAVLVGCVPSSGGSGPDDGIGGKGDQATGALNERSALVALGLGDRFFRQGDEWTVAWVYRNKRIPSMHGGALEPGADRQVAQIEAAMADDPEDAFAQAEQAGREFEQHDVEYQGPVLVEYEVVEVGTGPNGRVAATVEVRGVDQVPSSLQDRVEVPGSDDGLRQTMVVPAFESVDSKLRYTINELFNPVSKTFYQVTAGQEESTAVDLDGRRNLTMQFDSLPNGYPNLDRVEPEAHCTDAFFEHLDDPEWRTTTACWGALLDGSRAALNEIPPHLVELAREIGFDHVTAGIHFKPTVAQPDHMFWREGDLHPAFVSGPRGFGILVEQQPAQ